MKVFLYPDLKSGEVDIDEIGRYLNQKIPDLSVKIKGRLLLSSKVPKQETARELAKCRIKDPYSEKLNQNPLLGEVRYEEKLLDKPEKAGGVLYHGPRLAQVMLNFLPQADLRLENLHLIFTKRLVATWGADARYHIRVSILSSPSLISTTGAIQGPARPREFYRLTQGVGQNIPPETIREQISKDFLVSKDPRLTEVLKGYALQAASYRFFGEAFCNQPCCRLFNAHHQSQMLKAQLESPEFCRRHTKRFE